MTFYLFQCLSCIAITSLITCKSRRCTIYTCGHSNNACVHGKVSIQTSFEFSDDLLLHWMQTKSREPSLSLLRHARAYLIQDCFFFIEFIIFFFTAIFLLPYNLSALFYGGKDILYDPWCKPTLELSENSTLSMHFILIKYFLLLWSDLIR